MSRHSFNFSIDEDPSRVQHVELSHFDDPERGVWGMSYKISYSDAVEAPNPSHKRKREY